MHVAGGRVALSASQFQKVRVDQDGETVGTNAPLGTHSPGLAMCSAPKFHPGTFDPESFKVVLFAEPDAVQQESCPRRTRLSPRIPIETHLFVAIFIFRVHPPLPTSSTAASN